MSEETMQGRTIVVASCAKVPHGVVSSTACAVASMTLHPRQLSEVLPTSSLNPLVSRNLACIFAIIATLAQNLPRLKPILRNRTGSPGRCS
jgi:hypothetical protein